MVAGYRLDEPIGRGGMAVVYRAFDRRLHRRVALKILAPELARDREFRLRFIRESRAAAAVDHPNIIPIFEAGEASGVLFIAMRFVHGNDVRTLIESQGALPAARVCDIVAQVASALDVAHSHGLVHRDVKPANMLRDATAYADHPDHIYLSDFGLSKRSLASSGLTSRGHFMGTLNYVSPEQIEGREVDGRADLYALACSTFEMLSGEPPFKRDDNMAIMWAQVNAPPPPLTSRRPDLPPAVDRVLATALAKRADIRHATCLDFATALRAACGLGPGSAEPRLVGPSGGTPRTVGAAGFAAEAAGSPAAGTAPASPRPQGATASITPAQPASGPDSMPPEQAPGPVSIPPGDLPRRDTTPPELPSQPGAAPADAAPPGAPSRPGSIPPGDPAGPGTTAPGQSRPEAAGPGPAAGTAAGPQPGLVPGPGDTPQPSLIPGLGDTPPGEVPRAATDPGPYGLGSVPPGRGGSPAATDPRPAGPQAPTAPRPARQRPWMMRRAGATILATCVAVLGTAGGYLLVTRGGHPHPRPQPTPATSHPAAVLISPPACTSQVAASRVLNKKTVPSHFVKVGGLPFDVVTTPKGLGFVSTRGGITALNTAQPVPATVGAFTPLQAAQGEALTHDGQYLLVAARDGITVFRTSDLVPGPAQPARVLTSPGGSDAKEIALAPGDKYAFLTLQGSNRVAVFNLRRALASGSGPSGFVGNIPVNKDPIGLTMSPNGQYLYVASGLARPATTSGQGTLSVIDVRKAETKPGASSVIKQINAGCGPDRVITSADGRYVWLTSGGGNALLGYSAAKLISDPKHALIARVALGEIPLGLTMLHNDSVIVVANSNRDQLGGAGSSLAVVNVAKALERNPGAVVGQIDAGTTPRQFALEPGGRTLLVTNTESGEVQAIDITHLP